MDDMDGLMLMNVVSYRGMWVETIDFEPVNFNEKSYLIEVCGLKLFLQQLRNLE